jgi:hypothetical protein
MGVSIAAFVCNAKRMRSAAMQVAIEEWEADPRYQHDKYHRADRSSVGRTQRSDLTP